MDRVAKGCQILIQPGSLMGLSRDPLGTKISVVHIFKSEFDTLKIGLWPEWHLRQGGGRHRENAAHRN